MARILENDTLRILVENELPVPRFKCAATPEEARQAAENLNTAVVVKALVPVGSRGKAGAVIYASTPEEAEKHTEFLLGSSVQHYPIEKVLICEKINIDQELFVSITVDKYLRCPVVLASTAGGVDLPEIVARNPEKIRTVYLDPYRGVPYYLAKEIWADLGLTGSVLRAAAAVLTKMYAVFNKYDCNLLEVNPLAITKDSKVCVVSAVMSVDDAALFRHPELDHVVQMENDNAWRPLTELEKDFAEINELDPYRGSAMYTELESGDIAFMCGGGGGSLLMFDTLLQYGGKPANYSEFGGNPPERKIYGLAKVMLSKPGVRGLFVCANITNSTQVDVVAHGIVRALQETGKDSDFPVLVRLAGVNDEIGREIFAAAGVEYYGEEITMTMAAKKMVEKMNSIKPKAG